MLDAHESPESRLAAQSSNQLWGNLDKPILKGRAEAWRGELPENEVAIVEAVCADLMAAFGYSITLPARPLTKTETESKPAIESLPGDADPRRLQHAHLLELYKEHNVMPKRQGG
jgi:hypothetical protein